MAAACKGGNLDIVNLLLELKDDRQIRIHDRGNEAFESACRAGHIHIVRRLLELEGDRRVTVHAYQTDEPSGSSDGALVAAC